LWNESFFSAPQLKRDPLGSGPILRIELKGDELKLLKRIAAFVFGVGFLWGTLKWQVTWLALGLLIACWLAALATVRYIARREQESFGGWRDWTIVGFIGTAAATLPMLLTGNTSFPMALLLAVSRGVGGGAAFGAIAFALTSPTPSHPVEAPDPQEADKPPTSAA